mmetsp:Transcript_23606/g.35848  ORF Transcript_23606/g.35848 Transcript_23606/m.35848 type:complete len:343 (+) Transcript_23606:1705-2733(+)
MTTSKTLTKFLNPFVSTNKLILTPQPPTHAAAATTQIQHLLPPAPQPTLPGKGKITTLQKRFQYANHNIIIHSKISNGFDIHPELVKGIGWEHIGNAMNYASEELRKAYVKTSFRLWATNQHLHKISKNDRRVPTQDYRCDRFNQLHEDWVHSFRCKASRPIYHQASQTLRTTLNDIKIAAPMIDLLLSGINQWISNQSIQFPSEPPSFTDSIALLHYRPFYEQTEIGWDQVLCGRLSPLWFTSHTEYTRQQHLPQQYSSSIIGPKLIQALWTFSLQFWYNRNGYIHGDDSPLINWQTRRLESKISAAYSSQSLIPDTNDQTLLFSKDLTSMLQLSDDQKFN